MDIIEWVRCVYIKGINSKNDKFMIAAFPSNESKIFDYNRVIKDLNGLSKDQFIKILSNNFNIIQKNKHLSTN